MNFRKLVLLINHIKNRCLEFYQPFKQLSVDERMVKVKPGHTWSNACEISQPNGGLSCGSLPIPPVTHWTLMSTRERRKKVQESMAWLIMLLCNWSDHFVSKGTTFMSTTFTHQQSFLRIYTYHYGIYATGTFRTNRVVIPVDVKAMKEALSQWGILRGTGYYWHPAIAEESQPQPSHDQSKPRGSQVWLVPHNQRATTCVMIKKCWLCLDVNPHQLFTRFGKMLVQCVCDVICLFWPCWGHSFQKECL